jgi:hypothetical protein
MAGAPITFPASTAPGVNATENGGRLINAFAEPLSQGARNTMRWIRAAGLRLATLVGSADFRGALAVGTVLYVINGDKAYTVTKAGSTYTVTELTGTVGGSGAVIMARNMRATTQILVVHSGGMSKIESGDVDDFSDPDLPAANSVDFMDGYFFVTSGDGRVFASAINDVTFNALDFATAESSPDGLVRAVSFGRDLLLMGTATTEFWGNTGNPTGFPFSRGRSFPLGSRRRWQFPDLRAVFQTQSCGWPMTTRYAASMAIPPKSSLQRCWSGLSRRQVRTWRRASTTQPDGPSGYSPDPLGHGPWICAAAIGTSARATAATVGARIMAQVALANG